MTELTAMVSVWMNEEDRDYLEHHLLINEIFRQLNSYEKDLIVIIFGFCFYSEIAKMYNKPKSTISSQISRLEERLRKFIKKNKILRTKALSELLYIMLTHKGDCIYEKS
ncbi:MAG: hypothetical protein ACLRSW_13725 [Christensenellaceae bacterium]